MGFERREALADVDGGPQFAVDVVDPRIQSTDLGNELRPQRVELRREACIDAIDLLIESNAPMVQDTNVSPKRMYLRSHNVLKRLLDLAVHAHRKTTGPASP